MNSKETAYAIWRLDMWIKNYGSYTDIDKAVESGELIPGQEYPKKILPSTRRST